MKKEKIKMKNILKQEGLKGWKIKEGSSGLCMNNQKTIYCKSNDLALFLHEVAHALTHKWDGKMGDKTGHHSIWADKYTELVRKYLILN